MGCERHEHKAWYHGRTELEPGNTKAGFFAGPKTELNPESRLDYAMDTAPRIMYAQS